MPADVDLALAGLFRRLSRLAGICAAAVGSLVMVGWILNIPLFTSILPGLPSMKFNTALAFALTGLALILLQREPFGSRERRVAELCAAIVALLGLLTLGEYRFGWNFGIDEWLIPDPDTALYPGRMSPITAFNFFLFGVSLLLLARSRFVAVAQTAGVITGFVSMLTVVGYLYGVQSFYQISSFTTIAVHTAMTLSILSLGTLLARPEQAFMTIFVSSSAGGIVARRLLPPAMILPIALGWLTLKGQQAGLYGIEFGFALFAISNVVVLSLLVIGIARSLHRTDHNRLQAENALHQAHETALKREKKLNQLQSRFIAIVSHEFRTPLAGIQVSAELVQLYSSRMSEERKNQHLESIESHVHHLTDLLDDILMLSKAESVGLEFKPTKLELKPFCQEIVQKLQVGDHAGRITLTVEDSACPTISADYKLLAQAITNLLTNALKYSPAESTVWLDVACSDQSATFRVRDEGIGIPEEGQKNLFQLFYRASNVGAIPGTGLGLAIVKEAIEAHKGTVTVESQVDRGTTFILTLPVS